MKEFVSHSTEETARFATSWIRDLAKRAENSKEATLIGLSGHLGAGKTAFVKEVAQLLGINEEITSPTFVIMKIYEIPEQIRNSNDVSNAGESKIQVPWRRLIHVDAYRFERPEELEVLDFEKIMSDKGNLVMVEWPEQVKLENFSEFERLEFEMIDGVCTIRQKKDPRKE